MTGLEIYMARALLLLAMCVGIQAEDFAGLARTAAVNPHWLGQWKALPAGIFADAAAPLGDAAGDFKIASPGERYVVSYLHDPNPQPRVKSFWPVKVGACSFIAEKARNTLFRISMAKNTMTIYALKGNNAFLARSPNASGMHGESAPDYLRKNYPHAQLASTGAMTTFLKIKRLDAATKTMLSDLCSRDSLWVVLAQLQKVK